MSMESHERHEENEIDLLALLQVLVKRKMVLIKICGVAVIASVVYSLTLPNIYTATAKILPPQKEAGVGLSALLGQAGALAGLSVSGLSGGNDLYIGILKSRSVADAVIRAPEIASGFKGKSLEDARGELNAAVKVQAGKDGIIVVSADDKDPKRAALLANAFVDELSKTTVRLNLSKAGTERSFLEKRLELVRKDLVKAEDELKEFSQRNRIIQVESQAKASIEGIARLKAELSNKEVQLSVLRTKQTDQSPEVKSLERAVQHLKHELNVLEGTTVKGSAIPSTGTVPGVGLEYARKLREFKTQEAIYEQLTKQYEVAKISEAKDSSSIQILDEAVVPAKKSKPSRSLIVVMTCAVSFVFSVIVIFVQEYLSKMSDEDRKTFESIRIQAFTVRKQNA
ncbi:Wzz/FepE/Etk N-terminal domain-containing protein [Geomonas paludis]|uniref:Wzz/FepE/Etk N-terminal domain-containing protein n=1 Tax=Geomonas paludis TaxID=2740185 RepID=A0ABY4LI06_9BACT|nr:Wzz/FepE/Etk N-terminal domain-containing protein [Geomonas paludis]UPU37621.1 Wzz/FepE/Etk N-terminal domain-containing protein [Geomonas paludis]